MESTLYKWTDGNWYTGVVRSRRHPLHWGRGFRHAACQALEDGGTYSLCSPYVIHAYRSKLMAEIMDLAQGWYTARRKKPVLWMAKGEVVVGDETKVGCRELMTVRPVSRQTISDDQRLAFAILLSQRIIKRCKSNPEVLKVLKWAEGWLSATDRSWEAMEHLPAYGIVLAGMSWYRGRTLDLNRRVARMTDSFALIQYDRPIGARRRVDLERIAREAMAIGVAAAAPVP